MVDTSQIAAIPLLDNIANENGKLTGEIMNKITKILVALDFSDTSEKVFFTAADLSKQLDGSLHVIHIVQIHPQNLPESGSLDVEALHKKEVQHAENRLNELMEKYAGRLDLTTGFPTGNPAEVIVDSARKTGAELIVMGTKGRTGLAHLVMGSVAESVLRTANIPVMCIRGS